MGTVENRNATFYIVGLMSCPAAVITYRSEKHPIITGEGYPFALATRKFKIVLCGGGKPGALNRPLRRGALLAGKLINADNLYWNLQSTFRRERIYPFRPVMFS